MDANHTYVETRVEGAWNAGSCIRSCYYENLYYKIIMDDSDTSPCLKKLCKQTFDDGKAAVKNRLTPMLAQCDENEHVKRALRKSWQAGSCAPLTRKKCENERDEYRKMVYKGDMSPVLREMCEQAFHKADEARSDACYVNYKRHFFN